MRWPQRAVVAAILAVGLVFRLFESEDHTVKTLTKHNAELLHAKQHKMTIRLHSVIRMQMKLNRHPRMEEALDQVEQRKCVIRHEQAQRK